MFHYSYERSEYKIIVSPEYCIIFPPTRPPMCFKYGEILGRQLAANKGMHLDTTNLV